MRQRPFPSAFNGAPARSALAFAASIVALGWGGVRAQEESKSSAPAESVATKIAREVRSLFDKHRQAVVKISATDEHGALSGTGFFIDPTGTIYTSYTIGGTSQGITVEWNGRKCAARRQLADPRSGVAILKIDPEVPTPFLNTGKSDALAVGDPLVAIGYAMDQPVSPSWGTLAGFEIRYGGGFLATRHLRANVPVQRGQGGAPVLNMQGEVVGILISRVDGGSGCFSLPIEAAERVRKDLVMHGELRPGWLGVGCREATEKFAGSSAVIGSLIKDSPGEKAGLQPGDVLLQIDDREIHSPDDVLNASFFIAVRDDVKLRVLREGKVMDLSVTATDPPTAPRTAGDISTFAAPASDDPTLNRLPMGVEP